MKESNDGATESAASLGRTPGFTPPALATGTITTAMASASSLGALRAAVANSGWLMSERLVRLLLAVVVGAWVARHLGPVHYGEIAYGIAMVALWQAAANLGLDAIVVRDLARERQAAPEVLGTALRLRLCAAALGWCGAVATAYLLRPEPVSSLLIVAILAAAMLFLPSEIIDLLFQSQTRSRLTIAPKVVAYLLSALAKVAMILVNAPLWAFAAVLLAESLALAAALAWTYRKEPLGERWRWQAGRARQMLRDAWPLMLAGLSTVVYMRIDQLVLLKLSSERELGLYSAVLPMSQVLHMVPMTVCASVLPRLAVLKNSDPARYTWRMQQLFSAMVWCGMLAAAVIALCAPLVVGLLLGPAFADAVPVLQWHAVTNIFVFLGVAQSVAIVSDRTTHIALVRTLFGAVVSLALNFALVPRWGAVGAAWSAIAAYFCAAVLSNAVLAPVYLRMQFRALWPFHAR